MVASRCGTDPHHTSGDLPHHVPTKQQPAMRLDVADQLVRNRVL
jgi:hypothetical protein